MSVTCHIGKLVGNTCLQHTSLDLLDRSQPRTGHSALKFLSSVLSMSPLPPMSAVLIGLCWPPFSSYFTHLSLLLPSWAILLQYKSNSLSVMVPFQNYTKQPALHFSTGKKIGPWRGLTCPPRFFQAALTHGNTRNTGHNLHLTHDLGQSWPCDPTQRRTLPFSRWQTPSLCKGQHKANKHVSL